MTIGTLETENGGLASSEEDKAQVLLTFFKGIYRQPRDTAGLFETIPRASTSMTESLTVGRSEVHHELKTLNKCKSAGPDGIHPAIVQPLADVITGPITLLFQESIRLGMVPDDWRRATVVAIHKKGSRNKVENYRPVSLTSILCKCLERIIRKQVCTYLISNKLLAPAQHGFVQRRSCLTNLLAFLDEVTNRLDNGRTVEVCYLDFQKAFDSVSHRLLDRKMLALGIVGETMDRIRAFLRGRTFSVKVGEYVSETEAVVSGVPQGSVLGPLLFLLFINDLAKELQNPCFMFADDIKIVGWGPDHDVATVVRWAEIWDLPLNRFKCQLLTNRAERGTGGLDMTEVKAVQDLGVKITHDFKPSLQCQTAANKARGQLFNMCAVISCRKPDVFVPIYRAIVRPHLEYCVQSWAPYLKKDINCLEKVQQLATRMITGQKGKSYAQRLEDLDLFSLRRRRMRGDLIETFKIVKGLSGLKFDEFFSFIPSVGTRGHSLRLQRSHSRLLLRANFFANRVIPWWNKLPKTVVECNSVGAFKKAIDDCWSTTFTDLDS